MQPCIPNDASRIREVKTVNDVEVEVNAPSEPAPDQPTDPATTDDQSPASKKSRQKGEITDANN